MSYPFDQMTAIAGANQKLAMALVDLLRASGERQAAIVQHAFAAHTPSAETAAETQAFTVPFTTPALPDVSALLKEVEEDRKAALTDAHAAFEDWRANVGGAMTVDTGQQQWANAVQAWSQLFVAPLGGPAWATTPGKAAPAAAKPKAGA